MSKDIVIYSHNIVSIQLRFAKSLQFLKWKVRVLYKRPNVDCVKYTSIEHSHFHLRNAKLSISELFLQTTVVHFTLCVSEYEFTFWIIIFLKRFTDLIFKKLR